jgi:hypothetical protein
MAKSSSPLEPRVRFPATDSYWAEIEARLQRLEERFDMLHALGESPCLALVLFDVPAELGVKPE